MRIIRIQKHVSWLNTILSALLFSASFIWIDWCGWLILLFPLPIAYNLGIRTCLSLMKYGFSWGIIVFAVNFFWLLQLLIYATFVPLWISVALYAGVVLYGAGTAGVWFGIMGKARRALGRGRVLNGLIFLVTGIGYFIFVDRYLFWFVKRNWGYPFLNPFIPLAQYKWFTYILMSLSFIFPRFFPPVIQNYTIQKDIINNHELYRITTRAGKGCVVMPLDAHKIWRGAGVARKIGNWRTEGERVADQLLRVDFTAISKNELLCIVAPESSYIFPLNNHHEVVQSWYSIVPKRTHFLVSSVREAKGANYQTLYHLRQGLIMDFYDKTKLVPFVEKIPREWENNSIVRSFFVESFKKGKKTKKNVPVFNIAPGIRVTPVLCYELFTRSAWQLRARGEGEEKSLIFAFVNDSWFMPYLQTIMQQTAQLKSLLSGISIFYIAYSKSLSIQPFSDTV